MRHGVAGRQFGRNTSHRLAMFKNLANNVILQEQVVTTVQKAKETKRFIDRLITLGKKDSVHSRRIAFSRTRDQEVVKKLFSELAERYSKRSGGYTRVLKLSNRRLGDGAELALLELVDHPELDRKKKVKTTEASQEAQKEGAAAQPADPFVKFRKLFAGKKKKKSANASPAAEKKESAPKKKRVAKPKKESKE